MSEWLRVRGKEGSSSGELFFLVELSPITAPRRAFKRQQQTSWERAAGEDGQYSTKRCRSRNTNEHQLWNQQPQLCNLDDLTTTFYFTKFIYPFPNGLFISRRVWSWQKQTARFFWVFFSGDSVAAIGSLFSERFPMCSSSIVFTVRVIVWFV